MMRCLVKMVTRCGLAVAAVLWGLGGSGAVKAADRPLVSDENLRREEIRSYLLEYPEVITEALEVLRGRRQAEVNRGIQKALTENAADLYAAPGDPVLGNPRGNVTVVVFSDYQCGYCKRAFPPLMRMVKDDGEVRVVLKELPILGSLSTLAAQYALAANMQGKYRAFYAEMMAHRQPVTRESLRQKAQSAGLNMARLDRDVADKSIAETLTTNKNVAAALGLQGTPAFVIGSQVLPGFLSYDTLREAIKKARAT